MRLQAPFETVTASVDGDVLAALGRAHAPLTVPMLSQRIPSRSGAGIRLVLARLVDQGVVSAARMGRMRSYALNPDHLAYEHIIGLANLRRTLLDRLRRAAEGLPDLHYAALFGSAARDTMRFDSDIDLFFVRQKDADGARLDDAVLHLESRVARWTGNDVRSLVLDEWEVASGKAVVAAIAQEGVLLYGDRGWLLRRMIGSPREPVLEEPDAAR